MFSCPMVPLFGTPVANLARDWEDNAIPSSGELGYKAAVRSFNMIIILGCIVVTGAVLGGFSMAGGHVESLIHPSELLTIGGATLGAMIVMSPKKVLIDLIKG